MSDKVLDFQKAGVKTFKLDITRRELLRLAEGLQRKKRSFRLIISRAELLMLQDATDDVASGGATVDAARRLRALQRKLHALTGEELTAPCLCRDDRAGGAR